ncbi:putative Fe-S cluster-containing radical SAM superfamily protein [Pedobacter cryoconitis]|uniref:Putative Fe-S cluster-containing radical SAM superfamily protein n=1 Tax=Pedobacter cryoconitis TaxID=188932 RepID=A0A7W8ZRR4_9SPHI|nr:hypothetical protein [Pedobacter cryoconitis]MBB5638750.1 putative Fe-S cluster-containing radical SAM superfamily protein [Pedobacter cryoconitis]MBB6270239.1 putative Fe-S cluster-containing radical SAM superfamily protein [Pedobacter cryoconitis]
MKFFKVYFLLGKAHSPEHIHLSNFNVERNCTAMGELKWLIVFAENENMAIELAVKGYETAGISRFKFSQDFLRTYLRDFVA